MQLTNPPLDRVALVFF